jgi:hypothetical protein
MFVTSVSGTGDLSTWPDAGGQVGIAAGDAICRQRARTAGLAPAPDYRAWLSGAADDAPCRMILEEGRMTDSCGEPIPPELAGPWWRTDGSAFGDALPALLGPSGRVLNAAAYDEFGSPIGHAWLWTGTNGYGWGSGDDCGGWSSSAPGATGTVGSSSHTTWGWTEFSRLPCSAQARLLCFETGSGDPLPSFPAWARLAFVTSQVGSAPAYGNGDLGSWPRAGGATGLAAGDAICRSIATDAGIRQPDSFKAWLSDAATDAVDRFAHDGPWMRLDGILVASSKAELTSGHPASSIHVTVDGDYLLWVFPWTGTESDGTGAAAHCAGWTSGTAGIGFTGDTTATNASWTEAVTFPCGSEYGHLYCLQDLPLVFFDGFDTGGTTAWSVVAP